ncbi:MAG: hypothetical protein U1E76_14900 [Planctomycetota bacterium]
MLVRIARAFLVAPLILSMGFATVAAAGAKQAPPAWELKVNGAAAIFTHPEATLNFTLRGRELAGASAVLVIEKSDGTTEVLRLLSADKSLPLVFKFKIPKGNGLHGMRSYVAKVVGRTRSGKRMESNIVMVRWTQ